MDCLEATQAALCAALADPALIDTGLRAFAVPA